VADTIASSFKLLGIAVPKECNMSALWRYNGVNYKNNNMKTSIILALLLVIASACTNDSDATSGM
jgi:hypothetical protein